MVSPLSRRSFLALAAGATGLALVGRSALTHSRERPATSLPTRRQSTGGLLDLDLVAEERDLAIPGVGGSVLTYNGQIPGPLLEVSPGDRVRLKLHNRLRRPTNLHYHGLHIPPDGLADNVFLSVPPGGSQTYAFTIPADHPAGTFYYHPHRHGTVADQVFGGLGGVLLVRGGLDALPELRDVPEAVLFLKDLPADGLEAGRWAGGGMGPGMNAMLGREGSVLTVNGVVRPELVIAAGGLLRLRLVNGSNARVWRLALEGHPFHLIATDGGALEAPVELEDLLLAPGERAEVLIRGDREGGTFQLRDLPYNRLHGMGMGFGMGPGGGPMGMGGPRGGAMGRPGGGMGPAGWPGAGSPQTPGVLATLRYEGSVVPMALPRSLLAVDPLPPPARTRHFRLSHAMAPGMGMAFLINGQTFAEGRVDTPVRLGETEDWVVTNEGSMDHPFHVHINPFQVISRNGIASAHRAWKDVVLVRPGETVRLRMRFRDFPGRTVYHCHILDHEERGMMGILEIT